ncbi:MAG TPA: sulfatase-like hydrolase/transferase [Stellaceae bacterium]|nr:sulfatase-like hydrolase/transferase [Stellaceae bacterium]
MNILFLMADQFRLDALHHIGGYGRTDALDALAADGKSFRRAITTAPECIPARFALASGLYPCQTGIWQNGGITLSPSCWTWMQALMTAGYRTSVFGKTHFHEGRGPDLRDDGGLMLGYGLVDVEEIGGPRASQFLMSGMTKEWEDRGVWEAYRADLTERSPPSPGSPDPRRWARISTTTPI